jgi:hypothetical protein
MVDSRRAMVKSTARRKGILAAAGAGGTVALFMLTPWLGLVGVAGTAYLTYDWLRYRGKWGLRF